MNSILPIFYKNLRVLLCFSTAKILEILRETQSIIDPSRSLNQLTCNVKLNLKEMSKINIKNNNI